MPPILTHTQIANIVSALHFKLAVREPSHTRKSKPPASSLADQDADQEGDDDYIFIPMLDEARDRFVISLLPDYLRKEITFSRDHAVRFYQKINTILMKPPAAEEMSDEEEEDYEEGDEEGDEGDETLMTAAEDMTTIGDETRMDDDETDQE